jgi:hypothetical protein
LTNSFVTLLHAGIKTENLLGIVLLNDEWYGAVHTWQETNAENKKKSMLMLTIFVPGYIIYAKIKTVNVLLI